MNTRPNNVTERGREEEQVDEKWDERNIQKVSGEPKGKVDK